MTGLAVRRYADPAWRAAGLAQLEDTLRGWLLAAAPGSDHQLAYAKALADVATSPASLDLLAGLLAGYRVDRRARRRHRAALGAAAPAGQPRRWPGRTRSRPSSTATGPTPASGTPRAAWRRSRRPRPRPRPGPRSPSGTLPNATFRAVLRGFRDPDQDELLAPYAEKFYEALAGMWQDGASDMAQFFTEVGYPDSVVSQAGHRRPRCLHRRRQPGRRPCAGCYRAPRRRRPARCAAGSATPSRASTSRASRRG